MFCTGVISVVGCTGVMLCVLHSCLFLTLSFGVLNIMLSHIVIFFSVSVKGRIVDPIKVNSLMDLGRSCATMLTMLKSSTDVLWTCFGLLVIHG